MGHLDNLIHLKEVVRNFKKLLTYFLYNNIWLENCLIKLVSREKCEFYLFYSNAIFKDRVLFK